MPRPWPQRDTGVWPPQRARAASYGRTLPSIQLDAVGWPL